MKKIFLMLVLSVISKLAISQCIPCNRGSKTDPTNPVPGQDLCNNIPTPPYATNEFDWMQLNNSPFHLNYNKPVTFANPLENPFYNSNTMGHIAIGTRSDFRPDQGWELIKKDLGYLHDGSVITLDPKPIIYIVLYNRFSGKLRILADAPNEAGGNLIQDVNVYLEFALFDPSAPSKFDNTLDLNITALLSGVQESSQTLDQKTKVDRVSSRAVFPVATTDFFYADFQMAYDVCTCVLESGLQVRFEEVQSSTLTARGRLLATNTSIDNTSVSQDFLASVYESKDITTDAQFFNETYGSISQLQNDLNTTSYVDPNFLTSFSAGIDKVGKFIKLDKINLSSLIPDPSNNKFVNSVMDFVVGESGIDKVTSALDFFSSTLGDAASSNNNIDPQPTIIQGSIALSGKITSAKFQDAYQFYLSNPGSKNSEDRPEYYFSNPPYNKPPYTTYNEVLGTFAMLKKPTILISERIGYYEGSDIYTGSITGAVTEKLWYTYNQALNIIKDKTIISVALVFNVKHYNPMAFNIYNLTLVATEPLALPSHHLTNSYVKDQFMSPYVPVECLKDLFVQINFPTVGVDWPVIDVFLKVIFIPEYQNSDPTKPNNHVAQAFTYNLTQQSYVVSSTNPDLSTGKFYANVNENLTIPLTTFSSNTTIVATNHMEITGDINSSAGNIILRAHSITVEPGVIISPDITLEVGGYLSCDNPINPTLDGTTLTNFCTKTPINTNDPVYHANEVLTKRAYFHQNANPVQKKQEQYGIAFNAYPNPSQTKCDIDFTLKNNEKITIGIYDVTGKSIYTVLDGVQYQQGHFAVPLNMELLGNGIYFCTFTTSDGYSETKKLVITK